MHVFLNFFLASSGVIPNFSLIFFRTINGFNIFILVIFVKLILNALVFLYFFAKFCRIDLFVACGRHFPAKKLYFCVELWSTKSNVVMNYGIFPVATIAVARFDRYDCATPIVTIVEIEIFLCQRS